MMTGRILFAVATCIAFIVPAFAEESPPSTEGGRYTFSKVEDGFVRLDTQSGEVSLCNQRSVGWACLAVPEDRATLENEIARLRSENAALKKDILSRGLPLPPGAAPDPAVTRGDDRDPQFDSGSDIGRLVTAARRWLHRLVETLDRAER